MREKSSKDNTFQTTLRMPKELYSKIVELAEQNERVPAEQIRFMLKKYIDITEGK